MFSFRHSVCQVGDISLTIHISMSHQMLVLKVALIQLSFMHRTRLGLGRGITRGCWEGREVDAQTFPNLFSDLTSSGQSIPNSEHVVVL